MSYGCVACLHGQNQLLGDPALRLIVEVESSVDSFICTLLLLDRPGPNKPERPPLELVWVFSGQGLGIRQGYRLSNHVEFSPALDN